MTKFSATRSLQHLQRTEARRAASMQESEGEDSPLWYRLVTGKSIADLSQATKSLGKKPGRILDHFVLPLVFEHQTDDLRQESALSDQPDNRELAQKLGALSTPSLKESRTVDVQDVVMHEGRLEVQVDYRELTEEYLELTAAIREILRVPADFEFRLGAYTPAIIIFRGGDLSSGTVDTIAARVPDQLTVSPAVSSY
jgi:hypothetical protein